MVYGRYNELVNGVYEPTYNLGAPSCRDNDLITQWILGVLYRIFRQAHV